MSPRADVRQPGEGGGTFVDRKGEFVVQYQGIAEETMKPKSPDSPFKESLRVTFGIKGDNDAVSLGVAIEDPADDLWGFVPDPDAAPANDASALRAFIEANVVKEPVEVYVSGFIQSRVATEGAHTFERIIRIYQYTRRRDGQSRIGMVAVTGDGQTTSWTCPEPLFEKRMENTHDQDYIGPLSADVYAFQFVPYRPAPVRPLRERRQFSVAGRARTTGFAWGCSGWAAGCGRTYRRSHSSPATTSRSWRSASTPGCEPCRWCSRGPRPGPGAAAPGCRPRLRRAAGARRSRRRRARRSPSPGEWPPERFGDRARPRVMRSAGCIPRGPGPTHPRRTGSGSCTAT